MPVHAAGANALGQESLQTDWRMVSGGYFAAMGIPILRGRTFTAEDRQGQQPAMIVSAEMAKRFWPADDPVGKTIIAGSANGQFRIVGVAGDVRSIDLATDPRPTMYIPTSQMLWPTMTLVVRTQSDIPVAPAIRKTVSALDPQLAVFNVRTLETMLEGSAAQPRLTAWLVGLFAMLALLLAAIGVYGVLAYLVTQRTREIGIRVALGARTGDIMRNVVGSGLGVVGVGVACGLALSVAVARLLGDELFGVSAHDASVLAFVSIVLLGTALVANGLPARRAARIDPMRSLRTE
jgi:predicted permease